MASYAASGIAKFKARMQSAGRVVNSDPQEQPIKPLASRDLN